MDPSPNTIPTGRETLKAPSAGLCPRSPSLLVLADHAAVAERASAVARELARVLVTRTLLEIGVLVTNENIDHPRSHKSSPLLASGGDNPEAPSDQDPLGRL